MKQMVPCFALISMVLFSAGVAGAHCQIPCGIYDDQMRVHMIAEHIKTIEKSMQEINRLQSDSPGNYHQLVRWVVNKEHHADQIQEIVSQYFMAQRVKMDDDDYTKKLVLLHKMIVCAMKCKQVPELSHAHSLRNYLKEFSALYFDQDHHKKKKAE